MTHTILASLTGVLVGWGMRGLYELFTKSDRTSNRKDHK